jgi:hypothetical protein
MKSLLEREGGREGRRESGEREGEGGGLSGCMGADREEGIENFKEHTLVHSNKETPQRLLNHTSIYLQLLWSLSSGVGMG